MSSVSFFPVFVFCFLLFFFVTAENVYIWSGVSGTPGGVPLATMLGGEEEQQMIAASVEPAGKSPAPWHCGFMKHVPIRCAVHLIAFHHRACLLSCSFNMVSVECTFQTRFSHLARPCQFSITHWPAALNQALPVALMFVLPSLGHLSQFHCQTAAALYCKASNTAISSPDLLLPSDLSKCRNCDCHSCLMVVT